MRRAGPTVALLLALALPAAAQERVGVRTGDHPGHGRIVFDWTAAPAYTVETSEGRALLRFPGADRLDLAGARRLPRNVTAVNRVEGGVELMLRPGARVRHFRNGPKVAVDILDPTPDAPRPVPAAEPAPARPAAPPVAGPRTAAAPAPGPPTPRAEPVAAAPATAVPAQPTVTAPAVAAPAVAAPAVAAPSAAVPVAAAPVAAARAAAPPAEREAPAPAAPSPGPAVTPATAATGTAPPPLATLAGPPPIRARAVPRPGLPAALRLPHAADVGLAAYRRGDSAFVVLDTERPVELGTILADRGFAGAQVQRVAGAAVIAWPLAADHRLRVERDGADWIVTPVARVPGVSDGGGIRARAEGELLVLPAERASRVVSLADAQTGLPLLVGTTLAPGARQALTRSLPDADLIETFQGLAVLARSDLVVMRAGAERFVLSGIAAPRLAAAPNLEGAAGLTRSFDFPAQPVAELTERLRAQQVAIANAPPLLRAPLRRAAAETMLALGLPQEAQAMLRLAGQENAEAAADPSLRFLGGIAALLAGRAPDPGALDAPVAVSDEVLLWRGLRDASLDEPRPAAAALAATAPLLFAYPEALRRRILPTVAETLAVGGETEAAARVLAQAGDQPALLLARALTEDALGETDRALELYDQAARTRDRLMRARAIRHGVERRLALGRLDAAGAAAALEQALFAWRGDAQELATRERVAALRREAGEPRAALALLRESEALFPDQASALLPRQQEAFLHALEIEAPLPAVALFDAHPELLPSGEATPAVLERLAERLIALDLPERAAALVARAMDRLPTGPSRAALGARLAELRLGERDAAGALGALAESSGRGLPTSLVERRAILAARAEAQRGQTATAVEALRALGAAGDPALADVLVDARDHAGAAVALARHLERSLPAPPGELSAEQQRQVVRLAALLALGGDEAALGPLRAREAPRISEPRLARAFEALTTDPVRGLADLPRMARELELFRSLPLRTAERRG
jgi:hypothetical protein